MGYSPAELRLLKPIGMMDEQAEERIRVSLRLAKESTYSWQQASWFCFNYFFEMDDETIEEFEQNVLDGNWTVGLWLSYAQLLVNGI